MGCAYVGRWGLVTRDLSTVDALTPSRSSRRYTLANVGRLKCIRDDYDGAAKVFLRYPLRQPDAGNILLFLLGSITGTPVRNRLAMHKMLQDITRRDALIHRLSAELAYSPVRLLLAYLCRRVLPNLRRVGPQGKPEPNQIGLSEKARVTSKEPAALDSVSKEENRALDRKTTNQHQNYGTVVSQIFNIFLVKWVVDRVNVLIETAFALPPAIQRLIRATVARELKLYGSKSDINQ
jgi:hypothetical protein